MSFIQDLSIKLPEDHVFSGRQDELKKLQEILQKQSICILTVTKEIPCKIGKTVLAAQLVGSKPAIWIDARKRKTVEDAFQQLSAKLAVTTDRVKEVLSKNENLLIFDDIKDKELLKEYLPQGQSKVLVTSRLRDWDSPCIELGVFSPQEAVEFLHKYTGKENAQIACKIAEELDFLPTSLEKAAKLIIKKHAELTDFFGLREEQLEIHAKRLKEIGNLPSRNRNFVGRELSLAALEEALKTDACVVISGKKKVGVETGLGGVGKTQIALQYAYRNADKYPNRVFWVNAESRATLDVSYLNLADRLGVILTDEEKKEENILIKRVNRKLEWEGGYLLILDNATDQESLDGLLPKQKGHLLITSRSPNWNLHSVHVFKVSLFTRKESIALIQKLTHLNAQDADSIAAITHDLPIAVAQAAAYIAQTQVKAEAYCQLFNEKIMKLFEHQEPTDDLSKKTVDVTWEISMEEIARREAILAERLMLPYSFMAGPLMSLCSFLASRDIPLALLKEWIKYNFKRDETANSDLDRTLELLNNFSMIDWQESAISLHPLMQVVSRERLVAEERQTIFHQAISTLTDIMRVFNNDNTSTWNLPKMSIPHCQSLFDKPVLLKEIQLEKQYLFLQAYGIVCMTIGSDSNLEITSKRLEIAKAWNEKEPHLETTIRALGISYNDVGRSLSTMGMYAEALEHRWKGLEIAEKIFGEDHPDTATSYNNVASNLMALGRYEEALACGQKALKINTEISEEESVIAKNYNTVGSVLLHAGKYDEALANFHIALAINKRILKEDHPDTALSCNNIGECLRHLGRHKEALIYCQKAWVIVKKIWDEEHPHIATSYNNRGLCLSELGNQAEALIYLEKALDIRKKNFGEEHPTVAETYLNVGGCLVMLKRHQEALIYLEKALDIRKKNNFGEEHPDAANIYDILGENIRGLERDEEALSFLQKALAIRKRVLKEEHPDIARSYNNVGNCLLKLKRYREAFSFLQKALEIFQKSLGAEHQFTIETNNTIGLSFQELGEHEKALQYLIKVLGFKKKIFGEESQDTVITYTNVGLSLGKLGRHEEALNCFQKALKINNKAFGEKHDFTITSYNHLSACLIKLRRFEEALPYLQKVLDIKKIVLGEEHVEMATHHSIIGLNFEELGNIKAALVHFQKALDIKRKTLGEEHIEIAVSYSLIGSNLHALGSHEEALKNRQKALNIWRQKWGEEHPNTATGYNEIGLSLGAMGQSAQALPFFQKALEIFRRKLGEEHPNTANGYSSVAASLFALGKQPEALENLQKALNILLPRLGANHPDVQNIQMGINICRQTLMREQPGLSPLVLQSQPSGYSEMPTDKFKSIVFCEIPEGRLILEGVKEQRTKALPLEGASFYTAISRLFHVTAILKNDQLLGEHLIKLLKEIFQQETWAILQFLQNPQVFGAIDHETAQDLVEAFRRGSQEIIQTLLGIATDSFHLFPAKEFEGFLESNFESFDDYLANDYFSRKIKYYSQFFEKVLASETFDKLKKDIAPLLIAEQCPLLIGMAQDWLINIYGVKTSKWSSDQNFDTLSKILQENGPMIVTGQFGKSFYREPPKEIDDAELSRKVNAWNPMANRINFLHMHTIIVVGVCKKEKARGSGEVYFIDPSEESDPTSLQKDRVYRISYQHLVTNARRFELLKHYAIHLS